MNDNNNLNENSTPLSSRIDIIDQLHLVIFDNDNYTDYFREYNFVLTMVFLLKAEYVTALSDKAIPFINRTFDNLLERLGVTDTGFTTLDEVLADTDLERLANANSV